jgi:hypothetical protein
LCAIKLHYISGSGTTEIGSIDGTSVPSGPLVGLREVIVGIAGAGSSSPPSSSPQLCSRQARSPRIENSLKKADFIFVVS